MHSVVHAKCLGSVSSTSSTYRRYGTVSNCVSLCVEVRRTSTRLPYRVQKRLEDFVAILYFSSSNLGLLIVGIFKSLTFMSSSSRDSCVQLVKRVGEDFAGFYL